MLREAGSIRVMTGIGTNVCVESTTRHGFMLDFYTVLIEDCCGYKRTCIATIENVNDRFGVVAWRRMCRRAGRRSRSKRL